MISIKNKTPKDPSSSSIAFVLNADKYKENERTPYMVHGATLNFFLKRSIRYQMQPTKAIVKIGILISWGLWSTVWAFIPVQKPHF